MSRLDQYYSLYRRYCREIANKREGAIVTQTIFLEDGSGMIETKIYLPTESNPFNVSTEEVLRFTSPGDGARQLERLLEDGQEEISKG